MAAKYVNKKRKEKPNKALVFIFHCHRATKEFKGDNCTQCKSVTYLNLKNACK